MTNRHIKQVENFVKKTYGIQNVMVSGNFTDNIVNEWGFQAYDVEVCEVNSKRQFEGGNVYHVAIDVYTKDMRRLARIYVPHNI